MACILISFFFFFPHFWLHPLDDLRFLLVSCYFIVLASDTAPAVKFLSVSVSCGQCEECVRECEDTRRQGHVTGVPAQGYTCICLWWYEHCSVMLLGVRLPSLFRVML